MAPVPLSVVCLRAHPPGVDDEAALDALNARMLDRVNDGGRFFLSHTRLRGRYVVRVAFGNLRTTSAHAGAVWDELNAVLVAERSA
jgi:aromatic-L-amino-acid decarboxylase